LEETVISSIIQPGDPYRLHETLFLNKQYLIHLLQQPTLSTYDQKLFTIMPNKIPPVTPSFVSTVIPKIIHQSFSNKALSDGMIRAVHTWVNINPEYEYRFYDNNDRRAFIAEYFDKDVLKAYDMLIPGAYQCDLWRYCVIYIHGGIYADIKNGAVYPIHDFLKPEVDYFFINDCGVGAIYNACFGAKPRSPLLYNLIKLVVHRVLNKEYGCSALYPTGPLAMGKIILNEYGFMHRMPTGTYKIGNDTLCIYNHYHFIFNLNGTNRLDNKHKVVVYERHNKDVNKGIQTITGNPHYSILWENKKIYRDI
jgi:mannosyltransferase OCH1-like enzyme